MSDMQFKAELARCEYCEEKPCKTACPADCSPADFIMAARGGSPADIMRAASIIMKNNPLGGVCGSVCPDRHCMAECSHRLFDGAISIPDLQAEIIRRARELGGIPDFDEAGTNGRKVAVVGAGPAGLGAAALLGRKGYRVDIYEASKKAGGMCGLIPSHRLSRDMLAEDIEFIMSLGRITLKSAAEVGDIAVIRKDYDAVIAATGLWEPIRLNIDNEDKALTAIDFLSSPDRYRFRGKTAVIGGGATALDCAVTARRKGVENVEMISLEKFGEMPLTERERAEIIEYGIETQGRTRLAAITCKDGRITGIETVKVALKSDKFRLDAVEDIQGSGQKRNDITDIIIAIGSRPKSAKKDIEGVFYAGDCLSGPSTVVEAVASGKNAALEADSYITGQDMPGFDKRTKSTAALEGYRPLPVSLECDFFGRKISTPFLLSAAPPSDGYDQMKKAYEAGWSGGIMKTAFDNVDIHIPGEYMHVFDEITYGNCDNVSGHSLDRVCGEIGRLMKEYPDRLTMASTGGPVTGNDSQDMKGWQSNTKKLEKAGVMGIEYSLSCPQGGDGTEGDIVSQNAALTAKIVSWIMEAGKPDIPKLFKLTAAVTSIVPIIKAIKEVLDRYPGSKAGITLANTFPVMDFQDRGGKKWENGVLLGMSGDGVAPISYLTLSRAVPMGVYVSGNGGPMNYLQAANFLALGASTVQFCTIVMKYGYGIFSELTSGISHLMERRGIKSVAELTGIAQPDPVTDFMELDPTKKISSADKDLCLKCGNCTRCPYQAIELDEEGYPETDPSKCIGCSICTKKCFSGALSMRERTGEELKQLREN
ncbi:MAG: FAD-dependent oxidoreductase [Elusimicrobia bacterium]|nr:FAD-dependent oxidoreductase [Elusimicrobiota bacterium]